MNTLLERVARFRTMLGITQTELSRQAGVSLASVQNIEAGRANPSLDTLQRVLAPLGQRIELVAGPADWDALCRLGLPLTARSHRNFQRNDDELGLQVFLAAGELDQRPLVENHQRKAEALQALLLAIKTHFPGCYNKHCKRSPLLRPYVPKKPSGRVIKLARISTRMLAEYL